MRSERRIILRESLRRSLLLLLCLVLLSGGFPAGGAHAEAVRPEESAEEDRFDFPDGELGLENLERFGHGAEVKRDADGTVVSVNGYPVRGVRAGFNSTGSATTLQYETDFMDYPFWRPATVYDGNLAAMSLVMALSANRARGYNDIQAEGYDPALNVVAFLEDAGFTDIRKDDYSRVPTMFTVSTAIGARRMEAEGQEPFTLIAVAVCGAGYRNEWLSNLTPGEGEIHEGFQSAANLVVDRLSGYLMTHAIQGRVKVWLSGFSRAAAVSNLAAGFLNQAGVFPKEDVYAYTFATPAAVRQPPESGYENIFNVIDPMDPVPQVMPASWDYGRYGTSLYLPVQEFAGLGGNLSQRERARMNADNFKTENNYSPLLNLRIRLMLGFLLNLVDSLETYNRDFGPALTRIMEGPDLQGRLNVIRRMMSGLKGSVRLNRASLDDMLDFVLRIVLDLARRRELGGADRNAGSLLLRMMNEHSENTYLGNIFSIRNEIFSQADRFFYAFVKGPVTLTALDDSGENDAVSLNMDGTMDLEGAWDTLNPAGESLMLPLHLERTGDVSLAMIPADYAGSVHWTAVGDGVVDCRLIAVGRHASPVFDTFRLPVRTVRAGDTEILWQGNPDFLLSDSFVRSTAAPADVTDFLGITSSGLSWRTALILLLCVLGLLVSLPFCLAFFLKGRKKGRRISPAAVLLLVLYGIALLNGEAAYWFFADRPAWMWSWLAAGAVCLTAVHWILRKAGALHIPADGNRAGRWRTELVLMGTGLLLRLLFEWLKDPLLHAGFALLLGTAAFLLAVSDTPLTLARLQGKK